MLRRFMRDGNHASELVRNVRTSACVGVGVGVGTAVEVCRCYCATSRHKTTTACTYAAVAEIGITRRDGVEGHNCVTGKVRWNGTDFSPRA
jgi:hypothetical protein